MTRGFLESTFTGPRECVSDLIRWIRNPVEQHAVWRDYRNTWAEGGFMRKSSPGNGHARIAMIVSIDSPLFEVKQLAMLGTGLRHVGWRVKILLDSSKRRWHRRYFQAHGLDSFVYWDDMAGGTTSASHARELLDAVKTFQDVKQWSVDQCWIGPQILSSISRSTFQGAPDVNDPEVRRQLAERLPATLARIPVARGILEKVDPDLVLLVEANYAKYAPMTDLAVHRGVDVIQVTQPNRDDAFICRRLNRETRRQHPSSVAREVFMQLRDKSLSAEEESELNEIFTARYGGQWFLQARNQPNTRDVEKAELRDRLKLNGGKKVAVVFSHVLWDANLFFGEDLFQDYGEWFAETVKAAAANPVVNWFIKLHPANLWKRQRANVTSDYSEMMLIRASIGSLPEHVQLMFPDTEISTRSLLALADYAITVRGTVGTEAPCHGVTTLTAGTGRCDRFGFTVDSDTAEEYLGRLETIQNLPAMTSEQVSWARRHAHLVFCRKPWVFKSWEATFDASGKKHMLDSNLRLAARSWEEIEANGDLADWVQWAGDPSRVDYLSN